MQVNQQSACILLYKPMTNKEIILKSINYIEQNLKSEIDGMQVSQHVCYSLYHFIRLFQSVTGFSPKSYIQQRRLTEAVNELRTTQKKVSEIAYDFQFGSPEVFNRAFKKQFGINPKEIRNGYPIASLLLIQAITEESLERTDRARHAAPELVHLEERTLVGISFFLPDDVPVNDLSKEWGRLFREVESIPHKIDPWRFYQLQFWSDQQELGGMYFFTGVEVHKVENLNPLFVVKTIPPGNYLRFIHRGLSNKVGYTYHYIYNQFLPETSYLLSKPFNFEYYGELYKGACNEESESEIYIPVD